MNQKQYKEKMRMKNSLKQNKSKFKLLRKMMIQKQILMKVHLNSSIPFKLNPKLLIHNA